MSVRRWSESAAATAQKGTKRMIIFNEFLIFYFYLMANCNQHDLAFSLISAVVEKPSLKV